MTQINPISYHTEAIRCIFFCWLYLLYATLFHLIPGFPHIHGVAWIDEDWLNKNGFKDIPICDAEDSVVTKLADLLISCQIPEPGPKPEANEPLYVQHQYTKDKMLNETVQQVQSHHHTNSCLKYDGNCRHNFPRFPCKKTILAKPQNLIYSSEDDKKRQERDIEKKNKKYEIILANAKKLLDADDLEMQIEKKK